MQSIVDKIDGLNRDSDKIVALNGTLQSMLDLARSVDEVELDRLVPIISEFRQGKFEVNEEMIKEGKRLFANFIIGLHEYLAVMVYGEKISALALMQLTRISISYSLAASSA